MRVLFLIILNFVFINSCSPVEKPEHLMSKDEIASVLADLAIYDQTFTINLKKSLEMENINRFVLKKHNISAKNLTESYQFYLKNPDNLKDIYEKAQEIILEKDPKLKDYLKKNSNTTNISQ